MAIKPGTAAACAAACSAALTLAAAPPDISRGRALYEVRCQGCHAESVHGRTKRVAKDFEDVRQWVERWNASLPLRWDAQEIDDVALYLNHAYYRYQCPPAVCRVVTVAPSSEPPSGARR